MPIEKPHNVSYTSWICTSSLYLYCVWLHDWMSSSVHCRLEPSSNQVIQPVYTKSVDKWKEKLSARDQRIIWQECDMLKELGYPPSWQHAPPTTLPPSHLSSNDHPYHFIFTLFSVVSGFTSLHAWLHFLSLLPIFVHSFAQYYSLVLCSLHGLWFNPLLFTWHNIITVFQKYRSTCT